MYYISISSSGLDAALVKSPDFSYQVSENISNYFDLLNAFPLIEIEVASFAGLGYLCRFVFWGVLLISVVYFIRTASNSKEEQISKNRILPAAEYLLAVIIVNISIHLLSTYNSSRYYIIEVICMMILTGFMIGQLLDAIKGNIHLYCRIIICAFLAITWFLTRNAMHDSMEGIANEKVEQENTSNTLDTNYYGGIDIR